MHLKNEQCVLWTSEFEHTFRVSDVNDISIIGEDVDLLETLHVRESNLLQYTS